MDLTESIMAILPPDWSQKPDMTGYINHITGEESDIHPYQIYLSLKSNTKDPAYSATTYSSEIIQEEEEFYEENPPSPYELVYKNFAGKNDEHYISGDNRYMNGQDKKSVKEYHCHWNERNLFGKVTQYGMTIRYESDGQTMIKFDGIDGEWTYSVLKGPHGAITEHDLFIGANIVVFGRHLTISTANLVACLWNDKEAKRLLKQQDFFRKKIESLGAIPLVKKPEDRIVRNISRGGKGTGHHDLRKIMKANAKLGEQLASLGLSTQL